MATSANTATSQRKAKIAVLGASGYTGAELVRLLLRHPGVELTVLTADRRAGQEMRDVFPQFAPFALPKLAPIEDVDWQAGGRGRSCCSRRPPRAFTPMASATTATWRSSTRNSPRPRAGR